MAKKLLICTMIIAGWASLSFAQTGKDGNLEDEDVTVIGEFKPILADAVKLKFSPDAEEIATEPVHLDYDIPEHSIKLPYESPEVRPLMMPPEELEPTDNVYAKLGLGNRALPYLNVHVNSGRGKIKSNKENRLNWGAHSLFHNSPGGNLDNQVFSEFKAGFFGDYMTDQVGIFGDLKYERDGLRFYGYDHDTFEFAKDTVRQHFSHFQGQLGIRNTQHNDQQIDYGANLQFGYTTDRFGHKELNPVVNANGLKHFDNGNHFAIRFLLDYNNFSFDTLRTNRTILGVNPTFRLQKDIWYADFGLNAGSDEMGLFLFPDLYFQRELLGKNLVFQGGINGHVQKNNFYTLTQTNPFVNDAINPINSRVTQFFAALAGNFKGQLSYELRYAYKIVRNLPLYLPDTNDITRFEVIFDTTSIINNVHAELGYEWPDKFRSVVGGDIFLYSLSENAEPWHLPTAQLSWNNIFHVSHRLTFTGDLYVMTGTKSRDRDGNVINLKGLVDINLGGQFKITDNFHIFAQVNNLASFRHQRWFAYPGYGFNALGGLVMTF